MLSVNLKLKTQGKRTKSEAHFTKQPIGYEGRDT